MCPSNIHVFTYKTVYTGICTPKWTKMPEFYASHFCGALIFFVAHHFLWRTGQWCATELLWMGPAELFLWRTRLGVPQKVEISVAHGPRAPQEKNCGAPANPPGAPQKVKMVRHR